MVVTKKLMKSALSKCSCMVDAKAHVPVGCAVCRCPSPTVERSRTPSRLTDSSYVELTCYTTSIVIFFLLLAFVLVFAIDNTLSILTVS